MASIIKVDDVQDAAGNNIIREAADTITIGASGDTITIPSGATITNSGTASGFGGITEADTWRLTTDFTGNATPIASNWERSDTNSQGNMGTGMSQSSGIFTFPSTGFWLVTFNANFKYNGTTEYLSGYIQATINDSAYANVSGVDQGIYDAGGNTYAGTCCSTICDVTSVSNVKVRFTISMEDTSATCSGSSTQDLTSAKFIRLGDT
tara:strand:- start:967 stop:1590 length:624 start_codon:yes stop_codon:yes gene_type:complete